MEHLLNLLWLLLMVPGYRVWRKRYRNSESFRCLLALACALVLLFPVISATDDLRAMRQEMEDSPPFRRVLKAGTGERVSAQNHSDAPPLKPVPVFVVPCRTKFCGRTGVEQFSAPSALQFSLPTGRAPPLFSFHTM
jgi:hypothetical protein